MTPKSGDSGLASGTMSPRANGSPCTSRRSAEWSLGIALPAGHWANRNDAQRKGALVSTAENDEKMQGRQRDRGQIQAARGV